MASYPTLPDIPQERHLYEGSKVSPACPSDKRVILTEEIEVSGEEPVLMRLFTTYLTYTASVSNLGLRARTQQLSASPIARASEA